MDAQTSPARNVHLNIQTVHGVTFPVGQGSVLSARGNTVVSGRPGRDTDHGASDSENDTSARQSAQSSGSDPETR